MPQPFTCSKDVTIALGSNEQADTRLLVRRLRDALSAIEDNHTTVRKVSRFYRTPCFPAGAGPDFVNAAALLETAHSPRVLLDIMHAIEESHGRKRVVRWGQRTLDLDLIGWGDRVLPDVETQEYWRSLPLEEQKTRAPGELVLPHPRLQDRAFVLVPLNDVAPGWIHPVTGQSVADMLGRLDTREIEEIKPLPA